MTEPEQDRTTPAPSRKHVTVPRSMLTRKPCLPGWETRLRAMRREAVGEASRGRLRPFLWGGLASAPP